jgi:hypothetical protein
MMNLSSHPSYADGALHVWAALAMLMLFKNAVLASLHFAYTQRCHLSTYTMLGLPATIWASASLEKPLKALHCWCIIDPAPTWRAAASSACLAVNSSTNRVELELMISGCGCIVASTEVQISSRYDSLYCWLRL